MDRSKLSEKQSFILGLLESKEQITKKEVCSYLARRYYHNGEKYIGEVLSRMVQRGILKRVKPGVFKKGRLNYLGKKGKIDPNQKSLF
jgi:hypothetical protein